MKRAALALLAVLPMFAADDDAVLRAMRDEMERARSVRMAGLDAPYFLQYALDDGETFSAAASLGGLISTRRERFRRPEIGVRVGDYRFDNTNYVGSGYFFGPRYDTRFPIENSYDAMRRVLWLDTDGAYKSALEAISRKRAALRNVAVADQLDDFARARPVQRLLPVKRQALDDDAWTDRVRRLSAIFENYPAVKNSSVEMEAIDSAQYYVNSEGSEVCSPERLIYLRARAVSQAPDGMSLRDSAMFHAADFTGLPAEEEMARAITEAARNATALAAAPRGEEYSGPVLFEGMAAPQLFAEVLGANFVLTRRPVTEPGRAGVFAFSELQGRRGARILPEWMDVMDDPARTEYRGRPLLGSYRVDREGVEAAPLALVEKGVLKDFLRTRQPVRGFEGSNGRARLPGAFGASAAAISNLLVRASETVPAAELKKKLLEICDARGLPYGIVVRKMDYPSSASFEEVRRLLAGSAQAGSRAVSMPALVYRVYPDGREELVRGLRFRGLNARSLKDILAAGDDERAFDFLNNNAPFALMGGAGYVAESTVIAPSVLIDDLELQRMEDELPKLPLVPPPALEARACATDSRPCD